MVAVLSLVSCKKDDRNDTTSYLVVKGTVYNSSTSLPIKGIKVEMASYKSSDKDKAVPQLTDVSYTDSEGTYTVTVSRISSSDFYDIKVSDVDGAENGGEFLGSEIKYLEWNGVENPLYGQDFYLEKK